MQTGRLLSDSEQNQVQHKTWPLQSSGLSLSETRYPARLRMPGHQHDQAAFSFVLAGGYSETVVRCER
jgi:hypothetical protein